MEIVKETSRGLAQRLRLYAERFSAVAVIALAHRWTRVIVIAVFVILSMFYMSVSYTHLTLPTN